LPAFRGRSTRFFHLHQIPLGIQAWLSERSGEWYTPAYSVAAQDAALSLAVAAALSGILVRWSLWQDVAWLRIGIGLLSLLLPWQPFVPQFDNPEWHSVAAWTLATGYSATILVAVVLPFRLQMRRTLLAIALLLGVTLAVWRLESWEWLLGGSLLAALVLLAYGLVRTPVWETRRRPTRG
jgi:threonine/homoserine efflux transporter RhtA